MRTNIKEVVIGALVALALLFPFTAMAQKSAVKRMEAETVEHKKERKEVKVTTEFGLGVGAQYNWFSVYDQSADMTAQLKMKMSYGAALQFRLNIGKTFGVQPEITYSYGTVNIADPSHDLTTKARLNLVQVPLLLSLRIAMFRINAGPVFTLMDGPTYNLTLGDKIQKCYLGRFCPTVTYAAGVSVKFAKCMVLDIRYSGQFMEKKSHGEYLYSLDENVQPKAASFNNRISNVQLRFGYVF